MPRGELIAGWCQSRRNRRRPARNASAIGTLVARTSLFVTLAKTENAGTEAFVVSFSYPLDRIDAQRCLSVTVDQDRK